MKVFVYLIDEIYVITLECYHVVLIHIAHRDLSPLVTRYTSLDLEICPLHRPFLPITIPVSHQKFHKI